MPFLQLITGFAVRYTVKDDGKIIISGVEFTGGDGTISPNFGSRFSFSREECEDIVRGTTMPMGNLKTIFPCPAGGMSLSSIPESLKIYGKDDVFLVGGGLFKHGPQLIENVRYFRKIIE